MTDDATLRRVVEALYAHGGAGDWAAVEELLTEDFTISEADSLPYAGQWHGKQALRDLYTHVTGYWDEVSIEVKAITVGDGHGVGLLQFGGRARSSGERFSMPMAEVFRFEGDRVAEIKPIYWDTGLIARITAAKAA